MPSVFVFSYTHSLTLFTKLAFFKALLLLQVCYFSVLERLNNISDWYCRVSSKVIFLLRLIRIHVNWTKCGSDIIFKLTGSTRSWWSRNLWTQLFNKKIIKMFFSIYNFLKRFFFGFSASCVRRLYVDRNILQYII